MNTISLKTINNQTIKTTKYRYKYYKHSLSAKSTINTIKTHHKNNYYYKKYKHK